MKLFPFLFLLFVTFLILMLALWIVVPPENVTGITHPVYPSMRHSGSSVASVELPKYLAFIFGLCVIGVLVTSIGIGYIRKGQLGAVSKWLLWSSACYLGVFVCMVISYWNYVADSDVTYFLGFPAPTAWMMYGVWLTPIFFTLIYIFRFDQWVLNPGDLVRFKELVEQNKNHED